MFGLSSHTTKPHQTLPRNKSLPENTNSNELLHPHPDIRAQSTQEQQRQNGRAVLIIVHAISSPLPDTPRPNDEDDGRVSDSGEGCKSEETSADESDNVFWGNEVEECCGDSSNIDSKVEPFLNSNRK